MSVRAIEYLANFLGGARIPTGAGAGKLATSDAEGNISWGEVAWENVESLNAKLKNQGSPYGAGPRAGILGGLVFLNGVLKVEEEVAIKALLFVLPAPLRPEKQQAVLFMAIGTSNTYACIVKTNGEVVLETPAIKTPGTPIALAGANFPKKG